MPGSYPRTTNPYFPFERMDWIREQLAMWHDLGYSVSFRSWALNHVFDIYTGAMQVCAILNAGLPPNAGGRYVVVPASHYLRWHTRATRKVVATASPSAAYGWIIVWVADDEELEVLDELAPVLGAEVQRQTAADKTLKRKASRSLGHHPDRIHDRPGDPIDWEAHQVIHQGERDALAQLGVNCWAFDRAWGNVCNPDNLPKRRQYGNIDGKVY